MDTNPKTHEIDGVPYVEDGKPEPATTIAAMPLLYDGVVVNVKPGETLPDWVVQDGIRASKVTQLRRLDVDDHEFEPRPDDSGRCTKCPFAEGWHRYSRHGA